ncbi:hypothetical protein FOL47_004017 [Perkinsus chesapeaki]|uniref:Uncharacterized protein n=1 Tax=Perkinsus chesapeaki TaxID=330153 RepID=A0A7J6KLQ7_PERCH|nr:hypothetical protein FOL47_004017 [Perkinsus chesapeaki]
MPDDPSGASAASVASAASSSPSNLGVDTFLREIISQVLPKGEISSAFSNRLVEYGVGSVRALACMSQQAKQGFLNEVKDKEPFKDLSPGVGSTYLDSLVKEAEAQLEYASHIEPSAPGSLGPFQLLPSARRSRTKDFSESVRRIGKKFGPIPHECMPSQKLIECLRGSPWTYVDISKFFHKDSFSGRRDGRLLRARIMPPFGSSVLTGFSPS